MEKNYSYISPDLDWVEVDSSMCCAVGTGGNTGSGEGTGTIGPGGDGDDDELD